MNDAQPTDTVHHASRRDTTIPPLQEKIDLLLRAHQGQTMFSISETASLLGVSEDFIRIRVRRTDIASTRFGKRIMITIDEIARLQLEGIP